MVDKISDFMKKRRSDKLYRQWVKMDGLPQEEMPQESPTGETADMEYDTEDDFRGVTRRSGVDSRMMTLPTRYVLTGLGLIALLLIILAILVTVLIMQSC